MIDFVLQPTQEGELRRRVLFWLPAPIPVLGLVYLMVGGTFSAAGWTILLAASVGVGTMLLAMLVQPTPLPEGLAPPVSARRSLHRFRQFTQLRVALALVPMVIGAAAAVAGGGMYPLFAALALAWPQLLLAVPTFFTITKARRAMEAWGTTAYLWHALSRPARVTWPVATPLARSYRAWRADRDRRLAQQKEQDQQQEKAWKEAVREEKLNPTETAAPAPEASGSGSGTGESGLQRTRRLHALPEETGNEDNEPTALLPKPEPAASEGTPVPATGTRGTVNRAARQILEQGGALGLGVRRRRRGPHTTRPPRSNKP
ncbi:hypothetical protein GCM10007079_28200 [Nocardiopsis terrae]|uniref:Uncharacterized protein n=1 Tax=Nocardiopsis terrae TaxID=372655 RepID=A0ABR9HEX2_9ACTN|nr:hypothetical protein [Nocardiopsis terrae]MBE1457576.1 hypothetical protein [Nocardiopsis terrae]GHC85383.1 hypothetical protein GCM10007079_28200 [Nocardiopsis terrae]